MQRAKKPKKSKQPPQDPYEKNRMSEEAAKAASKLTRDVFYGVLIGIVWCGVYMLLGYLGVPAIVGAVILAFVPALMSGIKPLRGFAAVMYAMLNSGDYRQKQQALKGFEGGSTAYLLAAPALLVTMLSFWLIAQNALPQSGVSADMRVGMVLVFTPAFARYLAATEMFKRPQLEFSEYSGYFMGKRGYGKYVALMMLVPVLVILGIGAYTLITDDKQPYMFAIEIMLIQILATWLANGLVRNQLCGVSEETRCFAVVLGETFSMLAAAIALSIAANPF